MADAWGTFAPALPSWVDQGNEQVAVQTAAELAAERLRRSVVRAAPFDTRLLPDQEAAFQTWKGLHAPQDSGADYDLRGAFKAGVMPDPASGHWPDTFKKPNHPTFSVESQYAAGRPAGRWDGETFIPPAAPMSMAPAPVDERAAVEAAAAVAAERQRRGVLGQEVPDMFGSLAPRTRGQRAEGAITRGLLDHHVPGIRYLDQGSRGAQPLIDNKLLSQFSPKNDIEARAIDALRRNTSADEAINYLRQDAGTEAAQKWIAKNADRFSQAKGTSNYVLFDDSLVNILRKYAMPGAVGTGAAWGSMAPGGDQ